jgi:hypothetical protein
MKTAGNTVNERDPFVEGRRAWRLKAGCMLKNLSLISRRYTKYWLF